MRELRLIDPNGYSVPGAVTVVDDDQADTASSTLTAAASADAEEWGQDPRDYRIQTTNL